MNVWLFLLACQPIEEEDVLDPLAFYVDSEDTSTTTTNGDTATMDCFSERDQDLSLGITDHFRMWIQTSDFSNDLERTDLSGGSFGGLLSATEDCPKLRPIVFVHGNSDRALGGTYGGFAQMTNTLKEYGYRSAELYATTYGPANPSQISNYTHNKANVLQIRHFIEAVLEYTGAETVDVVAHSLGVTMARKAILGGEATDDDGSSYDVGNPLTSKIKTFVGIAGANQGLINCVGANVPVCSDLNGLLPTYWTATQSAFLQNINENSHYEGQNVYSIWSSIDEIVQYQCMIGNVNTCQIPQQDGQKVYDNLGHFQLKDQTGDVVYAMLQGTF